MNSTSGNIMLCCAWLAVKLL